VAFREKYADLRCLDHCPTSHYDWDMHQRHLIVEERPVAPWWKRIVGARR
jgi:hypothetical protein